MGCELLLSVSIKALNDLIHSEVQEHWAVIFATEYFQLVMIHIEISGCMQAEVSKSR